MSYPALTLPSAKLKLSKQDNKVYVWCIVRKKKLQLTPEEWVRQHVIHFLVNTQAIPIERINSEHTLQINGQNRRCDVVVVDSFGQPNLIIECKATTVEIDDKVFLQTSNYVAKSKARYFWMTNGLQHKLMDCHSPEKTLDTFPVV
jgi:hypothetical protein